MIEKLENMTAPGTVGALVIFLIMIVLCFFVNLIQLYRGSLLRRQLLFIVETLRVAFLNWLIKRLRKRARAVRARREVLRKEFLGQ